MTLCVPRTNREIELTECHVDFMEQVRLCDASLRRNTRRVKRCWIHTEREEEKDVILLESVDVLTCFWGEQNCRCILQQRFAILMRFFPVQVSLLAFYKSTEESQVYKILKSKSDILLGVVFC